MRLRKSNATHVSKQKKIIGGRNVERRPTYEFFIEPSPLVNQRSLAIGMGNVDIKKIIDVTSQLIREKQFEEAKHMLMKALAEASGEPQDQEVCLVELIELSCIAEPPEAEEAEKFALRREHLRKDAYGILQTARLLHHLERPPAVVSSKLHEAINLARRQNDTESLYASLAFLGKILLEIGNTQAAVAVLDEIEKLVSGGRGFVVGDETWFLEALRKRKLEHERVTRLARSLVPMCKDPAFKKRLESLTTNP